VLDENPRACRFRLAIVALGECAQLSRQVHVVARRCGHDAATLLRAYAKRTKKADASAAAVIGALSKGGSRLSWVQIGSKTRSVLKRL
jgi:hypothetical protein